MNTKTRAISEGAMMLALMAILLLADRQMAGFFELLLYFISIPVVVYEVRHGTKMAITLAIAASIVAFMFSTITGMFYTISAVLIGVVYGYGILKDWKNSTLLFFTILANVVLTYITVVLFANVFGYDIQAEVQSMMNMVPDLAMPGLDMQKIILEIVILMYMAMAFMQSVVTHLMSNMVLQRLKLKYRQMQTIFDLQISKGFGFFVIVSFMAYFFTANIMLAEWMKQAILGCYLIGMLVALAMGCITIMCYFRMRGKARILIVISMFLAMIPGVNLLVAMVGIADIFLELRKRMKEVLLHEILRKD